MINPTHMDEHVTLLRDVEVITIPFGTKTNLKKGDTGHITQALGGSYTVMIGGNLFRIDGNDADAEVLEKATGLTLLGDCVTAYDEPVDCAVTGKPTNRRQHLARMY